MTRSRPRRTGHPVVDPARCPACGSCSVRPHRDDLPDFEYGVVPRPAARRAPLRRAATPSSSSRGPRRRTWSTSTRPTTTPSTTTTARVAGTLGAAAGEAAGPSLRDAARWPEGPPVRRRHRRLPPLRRAPEELDIECAGVELHPEVAAAGRARGYDVVVGTLEEMDLNGHAGRYDIVSMNHVLEHVVEPGRGGRAGPAAPAARRPPAGPAADQHVVGGAGLRSPLGRLPLPPAPADVLPVRARAAAAQRRASSTCRCARRRTSRPRSRCRTRSTRGAGIRRSATARCRATAPCSGWWRRSSSPPTRLTGAASSTSTRWRRR